MREYIGKLADRLWLRYTNLGPYPDRYARYGHIKAWFSHLLTTIAEWGYREGPFAR